MFVIKNLLHPSQSLIDKRQSKELISCNEFQDEKEKKNQVKIIIKMMKELLKPNFLSYLLDMKMMIYAKLPKKKLTLI